MKHALLIPHPLSNVGAPTHLEVGVNLGARMLRLSYRLEGDMTKFRLPGDVSPQRGRKLWEHTCFEAFVRPKGQSPYYEFNFAPSREWDVMHFEAYREGKPIAQEPVTQVMVARDPRLIRLDALIMLDRLPQPLTLPLEMGLSAVLEDRAGTHSFWAIRHPPGRPDFHHADGFALELP